MGKDKALLNYHGQAQQYYLHDLLQPYCQQVFISCRKEQLQKSKSKTNQNYNFITDKYDNIGPLSGLLSAFDFNNRVGWLAIACDMPYINDLAIDYLIKNRKKGMIATAFKNLNQNFGEPLFTIWESNSYPILLKAFSKKSYSLRKILNQHPTHLLIPPNENVLKNINFPKDYQQTIMNQKIWLPKT